MSYKCKINNKLTAIRDGFTINEEMNEKLDSGTLQFVTDGGESEISSFDDVEFSVDNSFRNFKRKKLLVDTFNAEIESFNDTLETSDYSYLVNLMSETKLLERITCPALTISKRADGSIVTVWQKIKQYCQMYMPRILVYENSSHRKVIKCKYKYDPALETKFNMECPEMSWNESTLKEILTDLFYVADCIPVIKDNVLTFFDLAQRGNAIDTSKLSNKTFSQTSADYCDELTIPMKNTISNENIIVEYISPKALDSTELTTDNMVLITQKPIYRINSFEVYAPSRKGYDNPSVCLTHTNFIDLIRDHNFIIEEEAYKTLNPRVKNLPSGAQSLDYQFTHLSYKRNSNIISGFGKSVQYKFNGLLVPITDSKLSIVYAAARAYHETGIADIFGIDAWKIDGDIRNVIFRIAYETVDETTLNVGKLSQIKHPNNKLFDGQTSDTVSLEKQTIHEYAKANRLGNKIQTIYGEYTNENDVPNLADYIGEKILFSRSMTYYDGVIFFKGELIDNYILRDYYTGVLSKRRSVALLAENEAKIRHDVAKFYIVASAHYSGGIEGNNVPFEYHHTVENEHFVSIFSGRVETTQTMDQIATRVKSNNNDIYPTGKRVIMENYTFTCGRSFVCDFGFIDNAISGYTVFYSGGDPAYENIPIPYVDGNGEFDELYIYLCNYINPVETEQQSITSMINALNDPAYWESSAGAETWDTLTNYAESKPYTIQQAFSRDDFITINSKYLHKDNREHIKLSVQFEFTSDDERIIVTDKLAYYCDFIFQGAETMKVFLLEGDYFRPHEKIARGHYSGNYEIELINHANYQEVHLLYPTGLEENDAWCVADQDNNILLAVNGNEIDRVYFQLNYFRDNNVYNSQIDQVVIGKSFEDGSLDTKYAENLPAITTISCINRTINVSATKDFDEDD